MYVWEISAVAMENSVLNHTLTFIEQWHSVCFITILITNNHCKLEYWEVESEYTSKVMLFVVYCTMCGFLISYYKRISINLFLIKALYRKSWQKYFSCLCRMYFNLNVFWIAVGLYLEMIWWAFLSITEHSIIQLIYESIFFCFLYI